MKGNCKEINRSVMEVATTKKNIKMNITEIKNKKYIINVFPSLF
jgi:peroxiredoxin